MSAAQPSVLTSFLLVSVAYFLCLWLNFAEFAQLSIYSLGMTVFSALIFLRMPLSFKTSASIPNESRSRRTFASLRHPQASAGAAEARRSSLAA